ncbi:alpha/beta hydrolase [uncultured Jatrophihabitans sp.]|uniref:alpha/beta hydrolase n=1 Tax=uncultured Jatrophihabitans sp. TaxID=1610747 RepID=UPI0035CAB28C
MPAPRLIPVGRTDNPRAAVLVMHGGASRRGEPMVSPTQLSVLRMVPIAGRVNRLGRGELAVFRLLNSVRGWDTRHTPVQDARWALEQIHDRYGDLPVGLIGHSLGGRAALLVTPHPQVSCTVALAPWVYAQDDVDLGGRRALFVHGTQDRIASPQNSAAVARRAARTGEVGYIRIDGGKHAMLSHHREYDGYAAAFTLACLLDERPRHLPAPVAQVLDGAQWVDA